MNREQLADHLKSSASPDDKGWNIYHYLKSNASQGLPSSEIRGLLLEYLRLPASRPSLLHSVILLQALKSAETYGDFRLPAFVDMWDVANLRHEDYAKGHDDKGRTFLSLAERLSIAILRYITVHANEVPGEATMHVVNEQGLRLGFMGPRPMAAVKMFESVHDGRKVRMVRLVGADGSEMSSDWRAFHAKPWEIVGNIYQVLARRSEKSGNVRIDTIGAAYPQSAADVFGSIVGYVDSYDDKHKHHHIFDSASRHFVAESSRIRVNVGDYVLFAPIVPAEDPFKSAIVTSVMPRDTGRAAFGCVNAKVVYVNTEKGYFAYIAEGQPRAYARLKSAVRPLKAGDDVCLIVYDRRCADGEKRPYVAEAF